LKVSLSIKGSESSSSSRPSSFILMNNGEYTSLTFSVLEIGSEISLFSEFSTFIPNCSRVGQTSVLLSVIHLSIIVSSLMDLRPDFSTRSLNCCVFVAIQFGIFL
jgi:hypothetical protein